ncbi:hypothetical protein CSUB01_06738 [Colletotrichum sublineola]|uniref:Uncharacterized protein n=1 Tax=Colletotrichum sublineola TaxID=1173701 RepID=A0A066XFQ9_COLSU|nr:hypothetical protein CSUB01_06738 [Colletotrichum sublineola]
MQINLLLLATLVTSALAAPPTADKLLHCECRIRDIVNYDATVTACRSPGRMERGICHIMHSKLMKFKCPRPAGMHCEVAQ